MLTNPITEAPINSNNLLTRPALTYDGCLTPTLSGMFGSRVLISSPTQTHRQDDLEGLY